MESDHGLMVCKLLWKFGEPAKHTFQSRLKPEAGKGGFQLSLQSLLAIHHHIPFGEVEHSWGALKGSQQYGTGSAKQAPRPQRLQI